MSKGLKIVAGLGLIALGVFSGNPFIVAHGAAFIAAGAAIALGAILTPKIKTTQQLQTQSVMVRSAVQVQEILYGRDKKSGVVTYFGTSGDTNKYLWFVITVVEHEIDGYEKLWIDDVSIDIATEIDGSGYVTQAAFVDASANKLVKTKFYTGLSSQTTDTELTAAFPIDWTSPDHAGVGVAYFWVRLELDRSAGGTDPDNPEANVWHKGYPRELSVTARGAKVYDSRLDSLNGGTGTHRVDTPSTWAWSENSALCRTDYLRSTRFGPGYLSTEFDWSTVATAADTCDDLVSIPGSETQPRYTINGVVTVDDEPKNIVEALQSADHGITLFLPSLIEVHVGSWQTPSQTIDATWLAGGLSVESSNPTDDAYNAVRGQYLSALEGYTLVEFQPRTAAAYETEDGVGRVWEDIVLPFTREEYTAQRLAIIELKKSRQQKTATMVLNFRGEIIEPYQIVTVNIEDVTSDTYRVLGKSQSTDGTVTLQLREEVETDWNYTVPDLAVPPIIPSVLRDPDGVAAPTGLVASTGPGGIRLAWDYPDLAAISHIEVYAATTNDRSGAVVVERTQSESFFHDLDAGLTRYYWIIARGLNNLVSTWHPVSSTAGVSGTSGSPAMGVVNGYLTNEKQIVVTEPDGTGYDLTGSGGTYMVWEGNTDVTGAGPVYSVVAPATIDGLTMAINATTGVYSLSGASWTGEAAPFLMRAVYGGVTLDRWYTIIKSHEGEDGAAAKLIVMSATAQTFQYDTDGTPIGATSIVFTALQTGSTETVWWVTQYWNGTIWVNTVSAYLTGTGISRTLTETDFNTAITTEGGGGHVALRVWAHFEDPATIFYIDTITVIKVRDGIAGLDGADGADGSDGLNARAVNLTAGDNAFVYDVSGAVPAPANTTVTATAFNTSGTPYYNFLKNDASVQHTTANTYTYTPQAAFSSMPDKIEVELREGGTGGAILARDQLTMIGLREGSDAISILVTNEAHTLPTTNTGTVTYTGSGTDVRVFEGATALTYVTSAPGNGQWTFISVTPLNITAGALSGTGTTTATFAVHSAMTQNNASITLTINGKRGSTGNVVFSGLVKIQSLAKSIQGADAILYYIKPTVGTAIHNSSGTLTVEAHKVTGGTDTVLSTGTIQLYVGTTLVTVANGYAAGSDGYTGVFDSGDITGDVIVLLKDGSGGTVLDSITLVDIADGAAGGAGADAVYGYIEPSAPIAWTRAADQSTWTPSATTVDLDVTFVQAGVTVARDAMRITRTAGGILTSSATTHPLGDLNTSRITITTLGASTQACGIKFDYLNGSDTGSVTETVITSMAGADGATGGTGAAGAHGMTFVMSNSAHVIPTDSAGNNGVYTGSGTEIHVYEGSTELLYDGVGTAASRWDIGVIDDSNITVGTTTDSGNYVTQGVVSAMTADTAYIDYPLSGKRANGDAFSVTLRQSFSKAKAGADGAAGSALVAIPTNYDGAASTTPSDASIRLQFDNDGQLKRSANLAAFTNIGAWKLSGAVGDYSVFATLLSGTVSSGTFNSWLDLGTDRVWEVVDTSSAGGPVIANIQFSIQLDSTGEILVSRVVQLEAEESA